MAIPLLLRQAGVEVGMGVGVGMGVTAWNLAGTNPLGARSQHVAVAVPAMGSFYQLDTTLQLK